MYSGKRHAKMNVNILWRGLHKQVRGKLIFNL